MLTPKQKELLMLIHERIQETGVPPSFDEMKEALNLKSKSGIHRLITALEERGFIRRLRHRARALEVVKLPEDIALKHTPSSGMALSSTAAPGNAGPFAAPMDPMSHHPPMNSLHSGGPRLPAIDESIEVPVMGRIAAGVPISAIEHHTHSIGVPPDLLTKGEHFALEVQGDSMVDAGILDGDTVIIRRTNTANNGDIVVALIDDEEATLKRLRKKGDSIALEAANPAYETRIFGPDRVKVQGRLIALIRRY